MRTALTPVSACTMFNTTPFFHPTIGASALHFGWVALCRNPYCGIPFLVVPYCQLFQAMSFFILAVEAMLNGVLNSN
jgi:hypothetical protein